MKKQFIMTPLAVTAIVLGVQSVSAAPAMKMPTPAVVVEKAQLKSDVASRKYVAQLASTRTVSLPARISGVLEATKFKQGDMVKEGQLLYEIEDTTYRAKVEVAKAAVSQAEADVQYTKHDFERKKSLFDKKAVSELVFDEADRAYKNAQARLRESKAALVDAENSLSYTRIYAPFTGRIGKSTYSDGNYVTPSSQALAELVRVSPIYVKFSISERDFLTMFGSLQNLLDNGKVTLTLADNSRYPIAGKVTIVDNKVDKNTGTLKIWATIENPDGKLIPGGLVNAALSRANAAQKPAVTRTALLLDKKGNYVWVVGKDNIVSRRDVVPGAIIGPWQLIDSGLKADETVIVDGTHKAQPGNPVVPTFAADLK